MSSFQNKQIMIDEGGKHQQTAETVIAKDQRSLFEQHTAADSATQGGDLRKSSIRITTYDLRQSFGHIADQKPHDDIGTDFTVAEDLHKRHTIAVTPTTGAATATITQDANTINRRLPNSQVFNSIDDSGNNNRINSVSRVF